MFRLRYRCPLPDAVSRRRIWNIAGRALALDLDAEPADHRLQGPFVTQQANRSGIGRHLYRRQTNAFGQMLLEADDIEEQAVAVDFAGHGRQDNPPGVLERMDPAGRPAMSLLAIGKSRPGAIPAGRTEMLAVVKVVEGRREGLVPALADRLARCLFVGGHIVQP